MLLFELSQALRRMALVRGISKSDVVEITDDELLLVHACCPTTGDLLISQEELRDAVDLCTSADDYISRVRAAVVLSVGALWRSCRGDGISHWEK